MSSMPKGTPCPCGCGMAIDPDRSVGNIWRNTQPYWAYVCPNGACTKRSMEIRNQTGDWDCPWCHKKRQLIDHFRSGTVTGGARVNARGQVVKPLPNLATYYFNPPGGFSVKKEPTP